MSDETRKASAAHHEPTGGWVQKCFNELQKLNTTHEYLLAILHEAEERREAGLRDAEESGKAELRKTEERREYLAKLYAEWNAQPESEITVWARRAGYLPEHRQTLRLPPRESTLL